MIRMRWLLTHLVREHRHAPAVVVIGVSALMLARLFSIPL